MVKLHVGLRRLEKLCDLLENLPRKRFDYSHWVGEDWQGKPDLSCGTTACALGWATTIPSLRRLGLRLYKAEDQSDQSEVQLNGKYESGQEVFGDDTYGLFQPECPTVAGYSPGAKATPKAVAKHIRKYIAIKRGQRKPVLTDDEL